MSEIVVSNVSVTGTNRAVPELPRESDAASCCVRINKIRHDYGKYGMDEEERLLLAKRRNLLARTDWLGLNMQRPINISFRSSGDKDRIGKRRKVRSSTSRKGRPAAPRMVTPLFQQPFSPDVGAMGMPLEPEDIRIKIGTDALASQTQPSRRSHTPGRTSVRHPSTEFGPLSEETVAVSQCLLNFR